MIISGSDSENAENFHDDHDKPRKFISVIRNIMIISGSDSENAEKNT